MCGDIRSRRDPRHGFIRVEPIVKFVGLVCEDFLASIALQAQHNANIPILAYGPCLIQVEHHVALVLSHRVVKVHNLIETDRSSVVLIAEILSLRQVVRNVHLRVLEHCLIEELSVFKGESGTVDALPWALYREVHCADLVSPIVGVPGFVAIDIHKLTPFLIHYYCLRLVRVLRLLPEIVRLRVL